MKKRLILFGIFFVALIAVIIIICNFVESERLSNILLTVFASLLGGMITLCGVVLTIWHSDKNFDIAEHKREIEKKEEEKKKAKPYFTFQIVQDVFCNLNDKKVCFEDCSEFMRCNAAAVIENSNLSVFTINQIYHDGKWHDICINNVVLPNSNIFFGFRFNNYFNIFIKICDVLNNIYYYEIKLMPTLKLLNNTDSKSGFTFRQMREISEDELNKRIAEDENGEKKDGPF